MISTHRDASPIVQTEGMSTLATRHSVEEAAAKLEQLLHDKGVKLFVVVDHSGEAAKAGLHMPPTKLLIFGNPQAGTPLMLASPTAAIDLPLKILIWEDTQQKVWISYNSAAYLGRRHGLPETLLSNIAAAEVLAKLAAE